MRLMDFHYCLLYFQSGTTLISTYFQENLRGAHGMCSGGLVSWDRNMFCPIQNNDTDIKKETILSDFSTVIHYGFLP